MNHEFGMSPLNIFTRRKRSGTSINEMVVVKFEQAKGQTLEGKIMMIMIMMM